MTTPTISHIETTPFRLPLKSALRWGKHSSLSEARHVVVAVHLSDGAVGHAEALPRPTIYGETVGSICHIVAHELAPRIVGQAVDFADIVNRLQQIKNNQTAKGALDMALHAAYAQSRGQTLAEHLGCTRERVKVSYILGIGDNDTMLAEAEQVYQQGVRELKVKIGRDWEADVERIRLLQQIADDLTLYVDANETMALADATFKLDQLRELGVRYCEEPLPVEQIIERAALRAGQHLPLIGDDSCFSVRDLRRELALDTFDILNIKCARTGYTESLTMRDLVVGPGKGMMVGSQASSKLGAARHAIFAGLEAINFPSELSFFLKMAEDIVSSPLPIRDGYLSIADALAVEVDVDRLREAKISD